MNYLKGLFYLVFFCCISLNSPAQTSAGYRIPAGVKAIPNLVQETFAEQYPDVLLQGWFVTHITYWQNDISSGWYSDWYGDRSYVVSRYEKPTYFEVEFMKDPGELSRAVYNLYGYWYETRTRINGLPPIVREALKGAGYEGWKISTLKERIESHAWPLAVYRFKLSKGLKAEILRVDEKGTVIQQRYLED
jgi:hypothetical protein